VFGILGALRQKDYNDIRGYNECLASSEHDVTRIVMIWHPACRDIEQRCFGRCHDDVEILGEMLLTETRHPEVPVVFQMMATFTF
jgi:hypothetical protein